MSNHRLSIFHGAFHGIAVQGTLILFTQMQNVVFGHWLVSSAGICGGGVSYYGHYSICTAKFKAKKQLQNRQEIRLSIPGGTGDVF